MVTEARARGWEELENGELLKQAEAAGFEVLVTTDKNIRYQQNLKGRKIAIVVLGQGRWTLIRLHRPLKGEFSKSSTRFLASDVITRAGLAGDEFFSRPSVNAGHYQIIDRTEMPAGDFLTHKDVRFQG